MCGCRKTKIKKKQSNKPKQGKKVDNKAEAVTGMLLPHTTHTATQLD